MTKSILLITEFKVHPLSKGGKHKVTTIEGYRNVGFASLKRRGLSMSTDPLLPVQFESLGAELGLFLGSVI